MSTHNICFLGEIRKISILWIEKSALTSAMNYFKFIVYIYPSLEAIFYKKAKFVGCLTSK